LGPFSGTLADRYSRRRIMVAANLGSAACITAMIALFLTAHAELGYIYIIVFIRSSMQVVQQPAAAASVAMLVPASFLSKAAGLNQTFYGIVTVAAAPLGALAISLMPIGYALGIDLVTALLGLLPLVVYSIPQIRESAKDRPCLWRELCKGVQIVWDDRGLRQLYGLVMAIALIIVPAFTLILLLVKEHFAGGASQVALIGSASGAGTIMGGMLIAAAPPRKNIPWMLGSLAISCVMLGLTALVPATMFWLGTLSWLVSDIAFAASAALRAALLQSRVPNHLQGRVLSLLPTIASLAGLVGLAIATQLGELIGVRWLFVAMGLIGATIALLGFLSPAIRALETRDFGS